MFKPEMSFLCLNLLVQRLYVSALKNETLQLCGVFKILICLFEHPNPPDNSNTGSANAVRFGAGLSILSPGGVFGKPV